MSGVERDAWLTLDRFLRNGFVLLEERGDREIVIGLTGRFWRPMGGIVHTDLSEFRKRAPQGVAKAAWDFVVLKDSGNATILKTETRVWCTDKSARRKFWIYWMVIRPFSGLLRRIILKEIRRTAEHRTPAQEVDL